MALAVKEPQERSIFFAILVPMLVLILAEVLLFLGLLTASGVVGRLTQNDCDSMDKQAQGRRDQFQEYLLGRGTELSSLARSVNSTANALASEGQLNLDALDTDAASSVAVLRDSVSSMISTLRACNSSGVYVVLNVDDLSAHHEKGDYGRKSCVYISDISPGMAPSVRNDDLLFECAPTEIAQAFSITTGTSWTTGYEFTERVYSEEYDFLYVPFQTAYEASGRVDPLDYAYWSVAPLRDDGIEQRSMSYSIPLVLDDGTVYGVVGVDLSADYLKTLLPYGELFSEDDGSYLIATSDVKLSDVQEGESVQLSPVVCAGYNRIDNTDYGMTFSMVRGSGSDEAFHTVNGQYYISCEPLTLYNASTPFDHQEWVLLGLMPQATLHRFSDQALGMIGVAALFMLLLGFLGSIAVGYRMSSPLRHLSREVAQAELEGSEVIELSRTGIAELNQLTGAISELSSSVARARQVEQSRLEYERDFDLLTGLMNRRAFYRRAEEIFADADALKHTAIVMLDLDNLKTINDVYGHDCGDKYIRQAARCFEDSVPSNVLVSRVSGDEFFLLFYGYDSREQVESDIERLRQAIPQTEFFLPDGKMTYINASGGVALYLEDATEFAELMKLADFTMYQVKESGKNNIAYFDFETYQRKSSALRIENEFADLMGNYQLSTYHFQPIFDARSGEVFAYEALMRVSMGLLQSPADVLSLARSQGRLIDVERMTWIRSLECYEDLRAAGKVVEDAYLFLNSMANLSLDADELAQIAADHKDVMGNVVIEITEGEDMDEDTVEVKRSVPGLPGLFALDDYGSGYNSEVKLLALRPKFVKVDISIIRNIHQSEDKQSIVSNVVFYAHNRDMLVIAEGIESAEEVDALLDLDVDLLQGYYLAKPAAEPQRMNEEAATHLAARLADERQGEGEQS